MLCDGDAKSGRKLTKRGSDVSFIFSLLLPALVSVYYDSTVEVSDHVLLPTGSCPTHIRFGSSVRRLIRRQKSSSKTCSKYSDTANWVQPPTYASPNSRSVGQAGEHEDPTAS